MVTREYRDRLARINDQRQETIHAWQMMTNERINERRAALESIQDRGRTTFMGRVKSALMNKFSRRRESYDTEGSGPWGKTLHKTSHIQTRHSSGPGGGRRSPYRGQQR